MTGLGVFREWTGRCRRAAEVLALAGVLATCSSPGRAEVRQTDWLRTALPLPVGSSELNLGRLWGYASTTASWVDPSSGDTLSTPLLYGDYYSPPNFPQFVDGDEVTLSGLFKWRGEQLDPIADATAEPGHFLPGCELRAELVLHGSDCDVALGWYNVTGDDPPSPADIQPLVPKGSTYLNGTRNLFVPLGWDNRDPLDLSMLVWTPKVFSAGDITKNPRYAGGKIAFVMQADPARGCSSDKFSAYQHNPKNVAGMPWVTALIYHSRVDPSAVYLAFEDLPMSAEDWHITGGFQRNDGDFNDAVFFISGLGAMAACPDPACVDRVCDEGEVCSGGACVPGSGSGAGGGGAESGGAGSGDKGGEGSSAGGGGPTSPGVAGAATMSQGGAEPDTSDGNAGHGLENTAGASTGTVGGKPEAGPGSGQVSADPGCGCRVGSHGNVPARALWLALALAFTLLRSRRAPRAA